MSCWMICIAARWKSCRSDRDLGSSPKPISTTSPRAGNACILAHCVAGLMRLKTKFVISPLSNGNVALLTNMAKFAGLPWDLIMSAELFEHYKPDPETYLGAARLLCLKPEGGDDGRRPQRRSRRRAEERAQDRVRGAADGIRPASEDRLRSDRHIGTSSRRISAVSRTSSAARPHVARDGSDEQAGPRGVSTSAKFRIRRQPALADELVELVVKGSRPRPAAPKTSRTPPRPGERWVVLDGRAEPRCVIETIEVTYRRFNEVDAAFAYDEG